MLCSSYCDVNYFSGIAFFLIRLFKTSESKRVSHSVVPLFVTPWTVSTRLLCPWDSSGKITGVGSHSLLQGNFPTQGLNPDLPHCRQTLYRLRHQGRPEISERIFKRQEAGRRGVKCSTRHLQRRIETLFLSFAPLYPDPRTLNGLIRTPGSHLKNYGKFTDYIYYLILER